MKVEAKRKKKNLKERYKEEKDDEEQKKGYMENFWCVIVLYLSCARARFKH